MESKKSYKYSELVKNSFIFAIGTFGSKALQFLIVPIYTYVLTTNEYGQIDMVLTSISLLIPFITLLIQEAILRYLTTNEITKHDAVTIGSIIFFYSCIVSLIISLIFGILYNTKLSIILYFCLVLNSYVNIFQNYLKAVDKVSEFTKSGIFNTITFLTGNIVFLTVFKIGFFGYFYSMILSLLLTSIYITVKGDILNYLSLKKINKLAGKEMISYSIPLIPNGLMWWIMNAGDKYIINYYLGDSANGIYSISTKLAVIITTIFGIFMQSWQLSAIKDTEVDKDSGFYSDVYKFMMTILLITTSIIVAFTRPFYLLLIGKEFLEANIYSPLLCFATVLNCITTFLSISYIVNKTTKKAFFTTAMGAIFNLISNFILIKRFGLLGVVFGTIIGYLVVVILRTKDMKGFINMDFDMKRTIVSLIILFIGSYLYLYLNTIFSIIIGLFITILLMLIYKHEVISLYKNICTRMISKIIN